MNIFTKSTMDLTDRTSKDWAEILNPLIEKHKKDLINIRSDDEVFPSKELRFRAFKECDLTDANVVIIGQDPYPKRGDAQGLCFSLPEGRSSPSMRIILREMCDNTNQNYEALRTHPRAFSWEHLPQQGVLLLNTALTVVEGRAGSHSKYWKGFTEDLVETLSEARPDLIWVLWGNHAKALEPHIKESKAILKAAHPMAEQYGSGGFLGTNHFSKINDMLDDPIDWINPELLSTTKTEEDG